MKKKLLNSLYSFLIFLSCFLIIFFISSRNDDGYNFMPGIAFILALLFALICGFILIGGRLLNSYKNKNEFIYNFFGTFNLTLFVVCLLGYFTIGDHEKILIWIGFLPFIFGSLIIIDIYTTVIDRLRK